MFRPFFSVIVSSQTLSLSPYLSDGLDLNIDIFERILMFIFGSGDEPLLRDINGSRAVFVPYVLRT